MKTAESKNKFTRDEFIAYRLQIWTNTFNMAFQGSGNRAEMVDTATHAADKAVAAFEVKFEGDIV